MVDLEALIVCLRPWLNGNHQAELAGLQSEIAILCDELDRIRMEYDQLQLDIEDVRASATWAWDSRRLLWDTLQRTAIRLQQLEEATLGSKFNPIDLSNE